MKGQFDPEVLYEKIMKYLNIQKFKKNDQLMNNNYMEKESGRESRKVDTQSSH